ncbi:MAG: tannase/feruloyl esterase family alpha/beta hydrolase [Acidobacteriaceae bacterium]|nr:tannase/feruloyl esterase family alpha/beta hydrolase [Acidobacteriaceae bacterium]
MNLKFPIAAVLLIVTRIAVAQTPCEQLRSLSVPETTIMAAEFVPAGTPPRQPSGPPGAGPPAPLPAHCRVAAVLAPSSDSHIEMEIWLPPKEVWNGKFQEVGNGGWAGSISFGNGRPQILARTMSTALMEGYATSSTDTGHKGGGAEFALGHPEKLKDFAERAVHGTAVTSKAIIAAFYGAAPRFSYWNGCSSGGREGLKEAQRYPDDFDGIVAGAPANYWTHLKAGIIWSAQATHEGQPGNMSREKLMLLHRAALEACDALDGVKDGVIENPAACKFDPAVLECKGSDESGCLTSAQVEGARKMYSGAINPRTHEQIYPGMAPGSELGWDPVNGLQPVGIALGNFKFVVFKDPDWDYRKFNFESDMDVTDKSEDAWVNAIDPNLQAFFAQGGKLIQYHGWNDQQISPYNSVNYYNSVQKKLGRSAKLDNSYRLFMVPGMMHCGGGQGTDQFNAMAALERWREAKIAPGRIDAAHATEHVIDKTRPLCPYPQVAKYNGTGTTNDAANFSCKAQ